MKRKLIALTLAALMLLPAFAGCAGGTENAKEDGDPAVGEVAEPTAGETPEEEA